MTIQIAVGILAFVFIFIQLLAWRGWRKYQLLFYALAITIVILAIAAEMTVTAILFALVAALLFWLT